jgi:hypothetical protein
MVWGIMKGIQLPAELGARCWCCRPVCVCVCVCVCLCVFVCVCVCVLTFSLSLQSLFITINFSTHTLTPHTSPRKCHHLPPRRCQLRRCIPPQTPTNIVRACCEGAARACFDGVARTLRGLVARTYRGLVAGACCQGEAGACCGGLLRGLGEGEEGLLRGRRANTPTITPTTPGGYPLTHPV